MIIYKIQHQNIIIGWGIGISVISYIIAIVVSNFIPKKEIKRVETIEEKQG